MKALYFVDQLNGLAGSFSSHLTRIGVGVVASSSAGEVLSSCNKVVMSDLCWYVEDASWMRNKRQPAQSFNVLCSLEDLKRVLEVKREVWQAASKKS